MKVKLYISCLVVLGLPLFGCSAFSGHKPAVHEEVVELQENPVPGTVHELWSEPMYDTPRIPGQLDPAGNYYRLPHREVIEIRQQRFQKVEFPSDKGDGGQEKKDGK